MAFSPTHTRLTRTSSDLRVLSAGLLPPSPILTADDLSISSTSGEIPILLEATTHVHDSRPPAFGEPPRSCDVVKGLNLTNKLGTTLGDTRDLTRRDEALLENWSCRTSDNTCILPEFTSGLHAESPSDFCPARTVSGERKNAIHFTRGYVLGRDTGRSGILGDCSTRIKYEGPLQDPRASSPGTMELTTTDVAPNGDLDGDQVLMIATFHTYSTLPTPSFAPPSPSSSTDVISPLSSPVGRQRRPLERARAVRFPGRSRSPRLQVNDFESPSPTNHALYARRQLTDSASPACAAEPRVSDAAHPFVKHVLLPEELSWIKYVAIELWIDQEGFRAVKSCMQLIGYSPRTRSLHPYESAETTGSWVAAGVAEFMPTKRETFTFHYGPLDSPPTLRMVSVAGDETRDYISRQATLSVRANGVYTVLGTETFIASTLNSDTHGLRLCWKFDYLVSDRKVDGGSKTLPGEKTLTPLTFSCSPYLFHPLQGKKTGLLHVMKKNLVPKLGSQKLEPPASHSILPRTSRYLSPRDATLHIRSRSDAFGKSGHYRSLTRSPLHAGGGGEITLGANHIPRARRRRASSAGENSLTRSRNEPRVHSGMATLREGLFMPLFR